jgi:stage II sporulation protein D
MRIRSVSIIFFVFLYFVVPTSYSQIQDGRKQNISIRLFNSFHVSSVSFYLLSGEYSVYGDGVKVFESDKISLVTLSLASDSVVVQTINGDKKFHSIRFTPLVGNSSFKLKSLLPDYKVRTYDDELLISAQAKSLRLINVVNIEKYVAGVVQWEVGINNPQEFNKVKTIVCRTYALGNWRRHEEDKFQLCDEVHCQVFKGKTFNQNIQDAAFETAEYILVDDSAKIITASFFSNCGGQTMNSEDVWSKSVSSLRSVSDTFCLHKKNANWEKRIPKDLWLDYVSTKYGFPVNDTLQVKKILTFDQPNRKIFLLQDKKFIPLKLVREDMKLKSTFFSIKEEGDNVVFCGKGFGHGVGLCQEGATRMSEIGYSYTRIINYYYSTIHIIRFSQLDFFKTE